LEPLCGLGKLVLIPVRGSPLGSKCSVEAVVMTPLGVYFSQKQQTDIVFMLQN